MEQYMNATVKELAGSMLGFEMIRTEQRRDHWFIAFTGKQGKRNFQRSQRYYFQQGIVYLLSYTSSRGQPPAHLQEAEVIQDSFRLISP